MIQYCSEVVWKSNRNSADPTGYNRNVRAAICSHFNRILPEIRVSSKIWSKFSNSNQRFLRTKASCVSSIVQHISRFIGLKVIRECFNTQIIQMKKYSDSCLIELKWLITVFFGVSIFFSFLHSCLLFCFDYFYHFPLHSDPVHKGDPSRRTNQKLSNVHVQGELALLYGAVVHEIKCMY